MKRVELTSHFYLDEFVPRDWYEKYGSNIMQRVIDPNLAIGAELLRKKLGHPIYINNWWRAGQFQFSGWRPPDACNGKDEFGNDVPGVAFSQHRFGRALDLKSVGYAPAELLSIIEDNWKTFKRLGFARAEHVDFTPTWLHIDMGEIPGDNIRIFRPR